MNEAALRKHIAVLQFLRPLSAHLTANTTIALLTIGLRPGITVGEVQKVLGLQPTSTARALSILYAKARGVPGLDLVERHEDAVDLRVKHLYLTPKGLALWRTLSTIV